MEIGQSRHRAQLRTGLLPQFETGATGKYHPAGPGKVLHHRHHRKAGCIQSLGFYPPAQQKDTDRIPCPRA